MSGQDPTPTLRAEEGRRWHREGVYVDLHHPADLLLRISGDDLEDLFEHALFAFYDQAADLDAFAVEREMVLTVRDVSVAGALRALLAEALYLLETQGFVAVGAEVSVNEVGGEATRDLGQGGGGVDAVARLWGQDSGKGRHVPRAEIKAVTYHGLEVVRLPAGGFQATVLFDV